MSPSTLSHRMVLGSGFAVFAVITGCIPGQATYWRPTAPEGRVEKAWCPPDESVLVWQRDSTEISIRTYRYSDDRADLHVGFAIPEGHVLQLDDRGVEVVLADGTEHRLTLRGRDGEEVGGRLLLRGARSDGFFAPLTFHGKTRGAFFVLAAELPTPEPGPIRAQLPPMTLDGAVVVFPEVVFDLVTERKLMSLNC